MRNENRSHGSSPREASSNISEAPSAGDLRSLGRSAGLLSAAAALTAVGNLVFHVILARSAGANTYGAIVGLLTFGTIAVHMQSGVQYSVARETALGRPINVLLREGAIAVAPWLVFAALIACASPAIASFLHISSVVPVFVGLGYAVAVIAFGVPAGIFIGRRRFGSFAVVSVLFFVLRFALVSLFGWRSANGLGALEATFVAMATTVLISLLVIVRWGHRGELETPEPPSTRSKGLATESTYGALLSAALWTCWSMPVFFGRHFLDSKAAGSFGAAQLVMGGMLFLATPFVSALYPVIVQHRRAKDMLIGLGATIGVGLIGTVAAAAIGPMLMRGLYGDRYSVTAGELFWLGLSVTAVGAATYGLWVSQALQRFRRIVGSGILIAVLVEIALGVLWHEPNALAAGPLIAITVGSAVALLRVSRSARSTRRKAHERAARAAALVSSPGLLAFTAVGMMVHNEANSVEQCLRAVLAANDDGAIVPTVVVVASGSTDGTEAICKKIAASEPRVRVIVEPERSGKANAVNRFLRETHEPILVLVGGDTLLSPNALASLVNALADPTVGMTGGRIVPTNDRRGVANRLVHLEWTLHHNVALHHPKLGEVVAFRRCFDAIDATSKVDEVSIEAEVSSAGYQLGYVPEALVYNHGPRTLRDYLRQRIRIQRGHSTVRAGTGYAASTMRTRNQLRASLEFVALEPAKAPIVGFAALLELIAKVSARLPARAAADGQWQPITSAKRSIEVIDLAAPGRLPTVAAPEGADHA